MTLDYFLADRRNRRIFDVGSHRACLSWCGGRCRAADEQSAKGYLGHASRYPFEDR